MPALYVTIVMAAIMLFFHYLKADKKILRMVGISMAMSLCGIIFGFCLWAILGIIFDSNMPEIITIMLLGIFAILFPMWYIAAVIIGEIRSLKKEQIDEE